MVLKCCIYDSDMLFNPPPRPRDGVTGPCFVFKVSFSINLLQHLLIRLIQLLLSVCSCLITRNKGGPYMAAGHTGRTFFASNFRDKILRRFGMDFHGFWLPFRLHFLTFFMFSAYLFRASNLHRFFINFRRNSGTPDHVKKRF